ncbi:MAG: glycosyltransferase family 1 protein, partial [Gemmatimonadaceae bacterium]|nr:glycosyltransferase family 1 protein [Gemmatimonadaceae bacterium]
MPKSIASEDRARRPHATTPEATTILCFSHLRWDFVYQRPQHLMTRFARQGRVFYIEEPVYGADSAHLDVSRRENGLHVVVPSLPHDLSENARNEALRALVDDLIAQEAITTFVAWYYTPMALPWTAHLEPVAVAYDCMDELSLFRGAPADMVERERELIALADVVFTGGTSLYEAKRARSDNVHCFPSSVDASHFRQARTHADDPADQTNVPRLRLGFAGVIDERMDIELLAALASARPEWQLVLIGPVVKIDPAQLPQLPNIHYLGPKPYAELPSYLAGWDVALLPFALNESTRYISPTKTPEYLAAGLPVVSTPIRDVVAPYGVAELAQIGSTVQDFIAAVERALERSDDERRAWLKRVDGFLSTISWDRTFERMSALIAAAIFNETEARELPVAHVRRVA